MKFGTYLLLAILGVAIGVAAYAAISPFLPEPSQEEALEEELIGGKTKEQIAAEFLAGLDEEQSETTYVTSSEFIAFDGLDWTIEQSDAGGVSYISMDNPAVENEAAELELFIRTGDDATYESVIDDALTDLVPEGQCDLDENGDIDRTCFLSHLSDQSCGTVEYGELNLECYEGISTDTGERRFLFGQTTDFVYYVTMLESERETAETILQSFDLFPEEEVINSATVIN